MSKTKHKDKPTKLKSFVVSVDISVKAEDSAAAIAVATDIVRYGYEETAYHVPHSGYRNVFFTDITTI